MKAVRRQAAGHEHEFEPERGLPEALPAGERLLWQGSPQWRSLARGAFHVRAVAVYFALLVGVRLIVLQGTASTLREMAVSALWMAALGAIAVGLLCLMAWLSARATVYTITDKRIVMRIGIVLTVTFNLPFKRITAAGLHLEPDGAGDLPLSLSGDDRIAWLHLWPHARPWRLNKPEPMLRGVADAAEVARLLAQAWSGSTGGAVSPQAFDAIAPAPARAEGSGGQPALAGR